MLLKDLYKNIICTEENAVAFLRENKLLDTAQDAEPCHRCGSGMQEKRKRDRGGEFRHILRCVRKGCQTSRSVRAGNAFFHYTDINNKLRCNLSLCEILELVFFFVMEIPMTATMTLTGKSSSTITVWFNMCREVCEAIVSQRTLGKWTGNEMNAIEIDTSIQHNCEKTQKNDSEGSDTDLQNKNHGGKKGRSALFQSHLRWKELKKDIDDLFLEFLNDIQRVYR